MIEEEGKGWQGGSTRHAGVLIYWGSGRFWAEEMISIPWPLYLEGSTGSEDEAQEFYQESVSKFQGLPGDQMECSTVKQKQWRWESIGCWDPFCFEGPAGRNSWGMTSETNRKAEWETALRFHGATRREAQRGRSETEEAILVGSFSFWKKKSTCLV